MKNNVLNILTPFKEKDDISLRETVKAISEKDVGQRVRHIICPYDLTSWMCANKCKQDLCIKEVEGYRIDILQYSKRNL